VGGGGVGTEVEAGVDEGVALADAVAWAVVAGGAPVSVGPAPRERHDATTTRTTATRRDTSAY
jgi:hypothetical protein